VTWIFFGVFADGEDYFIIGFADYRITYVEKSGNFFGLKEHVGWRMRLMSLP
jgi:hypothetical protein